jgi:subtilisin family serine protease
MSLNLDSYVGGSHTIAFVFFSDDSFQFEGAYLDDILLTASGGTQQPNLTPFMPANWSDKIVVSRTTNTTADSTGLNAGETLYVDWSVINDGAVSAPAFSTELYVDDVLRNTWSRATPLAVNSYTFVTDYNIGSLTAGPHTIRVKSDSGGVVGESNELDNEYVKNITVGGSPDIRVTPLSVGFNLGESPSLAAGAPQAANTDAEQVSLSDDQKRVMASELFTRFDTGEQELRVIVNLTSPDGKPHGPEWTSKRSLQAWQRTVKARQDEVLSALAADEFKVRHRFQNQSGFSGLVSRKGLEKLVRHPRVTVIEPSRRREPHLAQGIPLMNAAVYRSSYDGAGVSVAIADSGVDYNHPRLGGGGFPNAKVIGGYDFGDDDADPMPNVTGHGTACAGIVAGDLGTVGDYIGGVAPAARIYALKISDFTGGAFDDDIIASWDWCITHRDDDPNNPLLVINTSFGGDRFFAACDSLQSAYATAANNAVAAGITLLCSSGNDGYCDSISSPACVSSVISVGAVFDSAYGTSTFCIDALTCAPNTPALSCSTGFETSQPTGPDVVTRYSNTSGFLTLLAPSHRAYTTDIVGSGGYSSGDYHTGFGGTSAASPYAAGAVVALQSAARAATGQFLTPAQVREKLVTTGDLVTDTKTAITKPRVNLARAIETLGQNQSFTIFNDGNASLNVASITADIASPWLSITPPAPFSIAPGMARVVALAVDPLLAPAGVTTRRLLVASDDADESPYPDGVFVNVTNVTALPTLKATRTTNSVVLHWAVDATGFVLESAPGLTATWQQVMTVPTIAGGENFVTNNLSGPGRYFRLRK